MTTSFEHSAMKSSFSLSSLRSGPAPPARSAAPERLYHSLTKKRKEPCREAWRRSWGSAASGGSAGDDLWPLLQHHYDYIMDNQIIDSCKEANGELLSHNTSVLQGGSRPLNPTASFNRQWSLSQLLTEFTELCQWLSHVQDEIYSSPENLSNRQLRVKRMSELVSVESRRRKFVEQAAAILERIPEACSEVTWRVEHLNAKWEGLRQLLSPEQPTKDGDGTDAVDTAHELRCLRRWLHNMEGRMPPPSMAAARTAPPHELLRKLHEHQVLQRDVECHRRIVSSVVRVCGGDAARALERRWHLLYLRAIEWQCHLEACIAKLDNQNGFPPEPASDSDEEPALKQPRLNRRGSPRRSPRVPRQRGAHARRWDSADSRESCSEDELDGINNWAASDSEAEPNKMERRVPGAQELTCQRDSPMPDQLVPAAENMETHDGHESLEIQNVSPKTEEVTVKTPPTVVKRKKPVNTSKFNQSNRKSKNCATFYFRHHDTDSDRQMIEDDKSQEESSEEEWTYVEGAKVANEDSTDLMTSSVEIQCDLSSNDNTNKNEVITDKNNGTQKNTEAKLESSTPDLLRVEQNNRCKDIERLVLQAEELVQKQVHHLSKKSKSSRSFKPLMFDEEGKSVNRSKMSRIKEWLNQSPDGKNDGNQGTESYDASGEYTTESEVDTSLTSEERNIHSSMDMSTSTCTVTPTHHAKVQLRKKRGSTGARPWSVSCLSQLAGATASLAGTPAARAAADSARPNMSISESALNTLTSSPSQRVTPANSNSKLRGSATTVQGHISSTNTMTEACTSCVETNDKQCWLRRKRLKMRRRCGGDGGEHREALVKSLSFCGRLSPELEDKNERSTASDPATSRKHRFDTTSTSGNESDEGLIKQQLATIAHLRRSIEKTHISNNKEQDSAIPEQNETEQTAPTFKLGPAGGPVRPRLAKSMERERNLLGLSLGNPSELWDLSIDKDSDIDKSVNTAGTEEHSSFSEQAWDFYQEKYNSEPYSEAPDSDAARRLLEFGDDYRAFLDSQSDCCSSLSAHPDPDQSPTGTRRRRPPAEPTRERSLPRYKRTTRVSPVDTPARKPKKSMSSAERKKSLLDSLERSRNNTSIESNDGTRRRKPADSERKANKRAPNEPFDLVHTPAGGRRRHSDNFTSDEVNSSLEYTEANKPDILDSVGRRRRAGEEAELHKVALTELRRASASAGSDRIRAGSGSGSASGSEAEEVVSLVRRSSAALDAAEALMARRDPSPDLLRSFDYTDVVSRCRENINLLETVLASTAVSSSWQREIRAVSARWSALRAAATRRGGARRLRRELAALRESLDDVCEPGDAAPQPHTRAQLHRRIEELKDRLSRLLECKVSMLKLTVSVRRALGDAESDDAGLAGELATLLAAWDEAHMRTSNELLSLEKAVSAWAEWEAALRELQGALRGDFATLQALKDRAPASSEATDQRELTAQIKQLAASLVDKKKGGSTCDSLSDSGISDGDSEAAGGRARRLSALRELARRLQAALAPNSPAQRAIAKRMEQTENEVRSLQESCRALVEQSLPAELRSGDDSDINVDAVVVSKTDSGDPDYNPRRGWVWRVLRSSLPIQLCLVALLLAAWFVERPRCCDSLNSLAQTLTPQLRYVRGPPPV